MRRRPNLARKRQRMLARWRVARNMQEPFYQPRKSRICGQATVAIITGRPLLEILERFGKDSGTCEAHISRVFASYGYRTSDRLLRFPGKLAIGHQKGHWVVWKDGEFFDAHPREEGGLNEAIFRAEKVRSWLHVFPPEGSDENGTSVLLTKMGGESEN